MGGIPTGTRHQLIVRLTLLLEPLVWTSQI